MDIASFERWVYECELLEQALPADDYIDLLSFNYKADGASYELNELIERIVDIGEYEKWRLIRLLKKVTTDDLREAAIALNECYDLYCRDYTFLSTLGTTFGLRLHLEYCENDWDDSIFQEEYLRDRSQFLSEFWQFSELEAQRVIGWLESGKIVFLNSYFNREGLLPYIDKRLKEDRISRTYPLSVTEAKRSLFSKLFDVVILFILFAVVVIGCQALF